MAYWLQERDICYIHIPKTSGTWVKRVLGDLEQGVRDGSLTHDLPVRWGYSRVFTVVREPVEWLASVWAHRVREKWEPYPRRVPWQLFCEVLKPYQDNKFPSFIDKVTEGIPGVVGWLYGIYAPPRVEVYRKEIDLIPFLESLGCRPEKYPPINTGFNVPLITEEIRWKVMKSEAEAYRRYGYERVGNAEQSGGMTH